MRRLALLAAPLLLFAVVQPGETGVAPHPAFFPVGSASAEGDPENDTLIGECGIFMGAPNLFFTFSGCWLPAPAEGVEVYSVTDDGAHLGYDIDFQWFDGDGFMVQHPPEDGADPCQTFGDPFTGNGAEESCYAPDTGENGTLMVSSKYGMFLNVEIYMVG
ncbi:MAG TPA: hypothetical protein VHH36_06160 [Candidatus Thermoplasmatota archaeon]|nr:hypothetical protein [Candidatus Thermoplasmatota archaeon]